MRINFTYFIDVTSSWCFWTEPTWAELKKRYAGRVDFAWKIALMDASGLPGSREQMEWYYRRSGRMMQSRFMLSSKWYEPGFTEYVAPNFVAEAAKDFGVIDDRVRLALAYAALHDGGRVGQWEVAGEIGGKAAGLDPKQLLERAKSPEIEARARGTTAEFHALKVTQRPTFLIDTEVGDRAVLSGLATLPPAVAALDAMLDDIIQYESHAAHFGAPPAI
jgi:predicted DsbA family dithiol-disulfide isomerase